MKFPTWLILPLLLCSSCDEKNDKNLKKTDSVRPILIDGQINRAEWADAQSLDIDDNNVLFLKEDDYYFYMAVKSGLVKPLYIDMFVNIGDSIVNIHASSQLGDRILKDTLWTDSSPETLWGQNKFWTSSIVKFDRKKMEKLRSENFEGNIYSHTTIPYDGFEFQFEKSYWKLKPSKLRIEIRNMIGPEGFKDVVFPKNSERMNSENWFNIR
ncbi:hypothetical protein [Flagellimonas meishanensis]|uniref:hypothetical protein n=1 Tax=Flagellimonas meishanensis TaxID=2873264 RepID=UPI001CA68787|nr:hypothetical protein [[Muricauda] meishanensis]